MFVDIPIQWDLKWGLKVYREDSDWEDKVGEFGLWIKDNIVKCWLVWQFLCFINRVYISEVYFKCNRHINTYINLTYNWTLQLICAFLVTSQYHSIYTIISAQSIFSLGFNLYVSIFSCVYQVFLELRVKVIEVPGDTIICRVGSPSICWRWTWGQ